MSASRAGTEPVGERPGKFVALGEGDRARPPPTRQASSSLQQQETSGCPYPGHERGRMRAPTRARPSMDRRTPSLRRLVGEPEAPQGDRVMGSARRRGNRARRNSRRDRGGAPGRRGGYDLLARLPSSAGKVGRRPEQSLGHLRVVGLEEQVGVVEFASDRHKVFGQSQAPPLTAAAHPGLSKPDAPGGEEALAPVRPSTRARQF
jgi:hypothetical protein